MKEKLTQLLEKCAVEFNKDWDICTTREEKIKLWKSGYYANLLIEKGVIVLPCKVGDMVYEVRKTRYPTDGYRMQWAECWEVRQRPFNIWMFDAVGQSFFLTKEEAEKVLKEKIKEENKYW